MGIPQAHSDMAILWPQEFCWRYSLFSDVFPCGKTKKLMRSLLHEHRIWKRIKGTNYLIWLFNDVWLRELDYKWRSPCQDFWQTHEPASPLQGWGVPRHDSGPHFPLLISYPFSSNGFILCFSILLQSKHTFDDLGTIHFKDNFISDWTARLESKREKRSFRNDT